MTAAALEVPDRRAVIAAVADTVMAETARPNTTTAYSGDWRTWLAFCAASRGELDVDPLEVSADVLVLYARWLATGDGRRPAAPESIRRRLTGVLAGWRERGLDYPRGVTKRARVWVADLERKLIEANQPTGRGQAPAATVAMLRAITAAAPHTVAGARDVALVLIGFGIAARRSELAFLEVSDITPGDNGGLYVHVRRSKTGARRCPVPRGQNEATCPVAAWERWRQAAELEVGAAFRHVNRHGHVLERLSPAAVGAAVTRAGRRAGLELHLTGHSLRSGLATEARRAGHTPEQIADQGGWQRGSRALQGYIRRVDEWSDNVLAGIGL